MSTLFRLIFNLAVH